MLAWKCRRKEEPSSLLADTRDGISTRSWAVAEQQRDDHLSHCSRRGYRSGGVQLCGLQSAITEWPKRRIDLLASTGSAARKNELIEIATQQPCAGRSPMRWDSSHLVVVTDGPANARRGGLPEISAVRLALTLPHSVNPSGRSAVLEHLPSDLCHLRAAWAMS